LPFTKFEPESTAIDFSVKVGDHTVMYTCWNI
jgi:hypothetical protein